MSMTHRDCRVSAKRYVYLLHRSFTGTATASEGAELYEEMVRRVELTTNRYYGRVDNVKAMLVVHGNAFRVHERQEKRYELMYDLMLFAWRSYERRHAVNRLFFLSGYVVYKEYTNFRCINLRHLPVRGMAYYVTVWRRAFPVCETVLQLNQDYGTNFWASDVQKTPIKNYCSILGVIRRLEAQGLDADYDSVVAAYCKSPRTVKYVDDLFLMRSLRLVPLDTNTNKQERFES